VESNWLVIELSEQAETAGYTDLESAITTVCGDKVEFFITIHYEKLGSYVSINTLFDGYVFVKDTESSRLNIANIKDSRFFQGVLRILGKIRTVDNREITILKKKLKNSIKKKLKVGSKVKITEGIFQHLVGEVISMEDSDRIANIRICCMSREIIAPVPTTCIEESNE